jgi:hypothetical protein
MYKLTICVPCFERPERTIRALNSVMEQDMNRWEAYFVGDKCPNIQKLIDTGIAQQFINKAKDNGNLLAIFNMPHHYGGWGYQARNTVIKLANSQYTIFMDNDDVIKPNHFSSYYNSIVETDNDLMYFDTWLEPIPNQFGTTGIKRFAQLEHGSIGHQEIIVKTSLLKKMPPERDHYGHDWTLIENIVNSGAKVEYKKQEPTYIIKGVGELREKNID